MGRPNDRSSIQHWQQFLRRAHVRQMFVRFCRAVRSVFQRKIENGRVQILHSYIVSVHEDAAVAHKPANEAEGRNLQLHGPP